MSCPIFCSRSLFEKSLRILELAFEIVVHNLLDCKAGLLGIIFPDAHFYVRRSEFLC